MSFSWSLTEEEIIEYATAFAGGMVDEDFIDVEDWQYSYDLAIAVMTENIIFQEENP